MLLAQLTPRQFEEWMQYAEVEPFGIDEGDFRAVSLNGLIAGIVGAKVPPENFTLRWFVEQLHSRSDPREVSVEARLDHLLGVPPRDEVN